LDDYKTIGFKIMAKHKNWHGASRKRILKKKLKELAKKRG